MNFLSYNIIRFLLSRSVVSQSAGAPAPLLEKQFIALKIENMSPENYTGLESSPLLGGSIDLRCLHVPPYNSFVNPAYSGEAK